MAYEREPLTKDLTFETPATGHTGVTVALTVGGTASATTEPFTMAGRGVLSYMLSFHGTATLKIEGLTSVPASSDGLAITIPEAWVEVEGDFDVETVSAGYFKQRVARIAGLPYLDRCKLKFTSETGATATITAMRIMLA